MSFLSKNLSQSLLFAADVEDIKARTGLTRKQIRRWTHTARTRNYVKRIEETGEINLLAAKIKTNKLVLLIGKNCSQNQKLLQTN